MADAETIVRDTLTIIAKENEIRNYEITLKPISSGGANYTSNLFLGCITGSKDINFFAKVAACGQKMRDQTPMQFYDTERHFYTVLAKVFNELEDRNRLSDTQKLRIPKFYGCNAKLYEETVVLEDLEHSGYTTHDRMKSFDWEYAAASVTELAKFHALSIAYQKDNKQGFDADIDMLRVDFEKNSGDMETVWGGFIKTAMEVISEEHRDKMTRYLQTKLKRESFKELTSAKKVEVIIHGDYRPSNLMHKTTQDGTLQVIPVDFQTLRGGSPLVDLFYFIFTGSDEQFRKRHFDQLIEHYYSELHAAITRLGVDPGCYTKEDFDEEVQEKLPYGLIVAIFLLPLVTVEAENAPKVDGDMEISSFIIQKTGKLFPERFNGIINDFVRWGILD